MTPPIVHTGDAFAFLAAHPEVYANAIVTDPPYSARTHKGAAARGALPYDSIDAGMVRALAAAFVARCDGWICVFTDHTLIPEWSQALADGPRRYVFAPVPLITLGGRVRIRGDGPSSWADYLIVSRPRVRHFARWGTLPGSYIATREQGPAIVRGAKPRSAMVEIVRDYSRPGDLVLDPFAGSGTTGLAAINLRRRFVGIEIDPERAAATATRLRLEHEAIEQIYGEKRTDDQHMEGTDKT